MIKRSKAGEQGPAPLASWITPIAPVSQISQQLAAEGLISSSLLARIAEPALPIFSTGTSSTATPSRPTDTSFLFPDAATLGSFLHKTLSADAQAVVEIICNPNPAAVHSQRPAFVLRLYRHEARK
jgi:hypothetical protein